MGAKQEAVVRQFLDMFSSGGEWPDLDKPAALFSDDTYYQVLVPTTEPVRGREALKAEWARQAMDTTDIRAEILAVASNDRYVFTERVDHVETGGKRMSIPIVAVFEVDDDGKISAWREYYDSGFVARELGLSPEDIARLLAEAS